MKRRAIFRFSCAAGAGYLCLFSVPVEAQTTTIERISVSSLGEQSRGPSYSSATDQSAKIVAFDSDASNLVRRDGNGVSDVFVRKTSTGITKRISVRANRGSYDPSISHDGRFVAFESEATTLARGDLNDAADIFMRDRKKRVTRLLSVGGAKRRANEGSYEPSISADGRSVAFSSYASNLTRNDTNAEADIFLRSMRTRRTRRVSVASNGTQANEGSYSPALAGDARSVAFDSLASNLVRRDRNASFDVFLHNLRTKKTRRVSVGFDGREADGNSFDPSVSHDGRVVAFWSKASNLTPEDDNNGADVFVRDFRAGTIERISVGVRRDGGSLQPSISSDGSRVAFFSFRDLTAEDTNDHADIYVFDRVTRLLTLVTTAPAGEPSNGPSFRPALAPDGSAVALHSFATNLISNDTNGASDVFLRRL